MIIKSLIVIIFSSLIFAACCNCSVSKESADIEVGTVPKELQKKADEFVISKTGKEFFFQYIKADFKKTTEIKDGYLMVYNFSIPENEGIEGEIRFSIDTSANIKKDREIVGIPNCISNPENCDFKISKDEAISIAKQKGFEEGIKNWDVSFIWNPEYEKYTWQIRTTLNESKGTEYKRSSGKVMIINPNNGSIIKTDEWHVN